VPAPPPPTNITVESVSFYTTDIAWPSSAGATGYTARIEGVFSGSTRPPAIRLAGLLPGTTYTGTLAAANHGGCSAATTFVVTTPTPTIYERVPVASEFVPAYILDIEDAANYRTDQDIPYALRPNPSDSWVHDRVAYYLELGSGAGTNWAFAAFDTLFTDVEELSLLPPGTPRTVQQYVDNLYVLASPGAQLVHGDFPDYGIIEFWPYGYLQDNTQGFTNASPHVYDHGDRVYPLARHGCLQIHIGDTDGDGPGTDARTVLAYNGWAADEIDDVGVGSSAGQNKDWTYKDNTDWYEVKRLTVLVRPADHATRDSDGDSVPDWWERRYLHHLGAPLDTDDDGDGFSNRAEYTAGTDPRDALSVPHITVAQTPHGLGVGFEGLSGRVYAVDYRRSFTSAWQLLHSSIAQSNAPITVRDTNRADRVRFYRLRISRP